MNDKKELIKEFLREYNNLNLGIPAVTVDLNVTIRSYPFGNLNYVVTIFDEFVEGYLVLASIYDRQKTNYHFLYICSRNTNDDLSKPETIITRCVFGKCPLITNSDILQICNKYICERIDRGTLTFKDNDFVWNALYKEKAKKSAFPTLEKALNDSCMYTKRISSLNLEFIGIKQIIVFTEVFENWFPLLLNFCIREYDWYPLIIKNDKLTEHKAWTIPPDTYNFTLKNLTRTIFNTCDFLGGYKDVNQAYISLKKNRFLIRNKIHSYNEAINKFLL